MNKISKTKSAELREQIATALREPYCENPSLAISDWMFESVLDDLEPRAENLFWLRLKQLGIEVEEEDVATLLYECLEMYFSIEVKSNFSFREIASLPKKKIVDALAILRVPETTDSTHS